MTLKQNIVELVAAISLKMNSLYALVEKKDNKKQDLSSDSETFYPSVKAVNISLAANLANANTYTDGQAANYILAIQKGSNNGVAELDNTGKVPAAQLPAFVDDILEGTYIGSTEFRNVEGVAYAPISGVLYSDTSSNKIYRWAGSSYVAIVGSLVLGENSTTAYRGDRGKTAYDHSQSTGRNPHGVTKANLGLSNVNNTSDSSKPVSTAQAAAIAIVQGDLNTYRTDEVGSSFPDYAQQLTNGLNF